MWSIVYKIQEKRRQERHGEVLLVFYRLIILYLCSCRTKSKNSWWVLHVWLLRDHLIIVKDMSITLCWIRCRKLLKWFIFSRYFNVIIEVSIAKCCCKFRIWCRQTVKKIPIVWISFIMFINKFSHRTDGYFRLMCSHILYVWNMCSYTEMVRFNGFPNLKLIKHFRKFCCYLITYTIIKLLKTDHI